MSIPVHTGGLRARLFDLFGSAWVMRDARSQVGCRRAPRAMNLAPMAVRSLLLHLALCVVPGAAAANVVDKLLLGNELACLPDWPFFCGNIHVACAGQTTLRAFAFTLRAVGAQATLAAVDDGAGVVGWYTRLRVAQDTQNQSVLLLPDSTNGYLKLQADGRYSFRHYLAQGGIMSLGRCE